VNRTTRANGHALVPRKKKGSELHSEFFPGEDASFDQLYSLQRIELTEKLRKNHGRDESWQILISLKMAGLVPSEKDCFRRYPIIVPTGVNVTTEKEFDLSAGESPFCSHRFVSILGEAYETIADVRFRANIHSLRISCE
jgi:hypothetical protein